MIKKEFFIGIKKLFSRGLLSSHSREETFLYLPIKILNNLSLSISNLSYFRILTRHKQGNKINKGIKGG